MPRSDGSIIIDTKILEDGFRKGIGSLAQLSKRAGVAIGAGVGVATVALFGYAAASMKAAEADKQGADRIRQIAVSMGRTDAQAAKLTDRLTKLADKTALATGVDDGQIKATQAKLLTFKELANTADTVGGSFDRATMAAIDMGAAGFGDAASNAVQLGKALNDPIKGVTALSRSGITFTAVEKKKLEALVKSGKVLEAQDFMLNAIEAQVGGTAAKSATASAKMGIAFSQLGQNAGAALLPIADTMLPKVIEATKVLEPQLEKTFGGIAALLTGGDATKGAADLSAGISEMGTSLVSGLTNMLPGAVTAITSVFTALATALGPMLPPLATALMQGLSQIASALPAILPPLITGLAGVIVAMAAALPGILGSLITAFIAGFTAIVGVLPTVIPALVNGLVSMIGVLAAMLPTLVPLLVGGFTQLIVLLATGLPALLPVLLQGFVALVMAIATALPVVLPALITGFVQLITMLATMLPVLLPVLLNGFVALITAIATMLPTLIPLLVNAIVTIVTALATALPPMLPMIVGALIRVIPLLLMAVVQIVVALVTAIVAAAPRLAAAGKQLFTGLVSAVRSIGSQLGPVGRTLMTALVNALRSAGAALPGIGKSLITALVNAAKGMLGQFSSIGRAISDGIKNGLTGAWNGLVSKLRTLTNLLPAAVKKLLGIASPSRVFAEVGRNTVLGLVKGIDGNKKHVATALKGLDKIVTEHLDKMRTESADLAGKVADGMNKSLASMLGSGSLPPDLLIKRLQGSVAAARKFAADLETLKKRGLNDDYVRQLAEAGVDSAGATASQLANATDGQIAEINKLKGELQGVANAAGKTMADSFYKAGIDTAAGLLKGIKAGEKNLKKAMGSLGKSLVAAIKKELGIKSPSKVFETEVGVMMALGIGKGFERGSGGVFKTMAKSVSGEMGRFTSAVAPRAIAAATPEGSAPESRQQIVNFNRPVRTYSEVVRALSDIDRGLAFS